MADTDFPRLLYRPGTAEAPWGIPSDLRRVADQAEQDAALADGWSLVPVAEAPKPTKKPTLAVVQSESKTDA